MIKLAQIPPKYIKSGRIGSFLCEVIQGDDVMFTWTRGGQLLRSDGIRVKVITDQESSVLKISNASHSDSANYTCIAKNIASEARVTANLIVEGTVSRLSTK